VARDLPSDKPRTLEECARLVGLGIMRTAHGAIEAAAPDANTFTRAVQECEQAGAV
jgi:hypothetical protein